MGIENRKHARRDIELDVRIVARDGAPVRCWLCDISEGGARLATSLAPGLPDEFILELSSELRRWCRVVWRTEEEAGVRFTPAPGSQPTKADASPDEGIPRKLLGYPVMVKCAKTGKSISTGIRVANKDELQKLPPVRRFTRCPHCKMLHGWTTAQAWVLDG
jgi:PilZ domain